MTADLLQVSPRARQLPASNSAVAPAWVASASLSVPPPAAATAAQPSRPTTVLLRVHPTPRRESQPGPDAGTDIIPAPQSALAGAEEAAAGEGREAPPTTTTSATGEPLPGMLAPLPASRVIPPQAAVGDVLPRDSRPLPDSMWLQKSRKCTQRRHSTQALAFFANLSSRATTQLAHLDRLSRNRFRLAAAQGEGDEADKECGSGSGSSSSRNTFRQIRSLPARSALLRSSFDTGAPVQPRYTLPSYPNRHHPFLSLPDHDSSPPHLVSLISASPSVRPYDVNVRHSDHFHARNPDADNLLLLARPSSFSAEAIARSPSSSYNEPCLAPTLELSEDEQPISPGTPSLFCSPFRQDLTPTACSKKPTRWPSSTTLSPESRNASPASPAASRLPAPARSCKLQGARSSPHHGVPLDFSAADPSDFADADAAAAASLHYVADVSHVVVKSVLDSRLRRNRWSADHSRVMPVDWDMGEGTTVPARAYAQQQRADDCRGLVQVQGSRWMGLVNGSTHSTADAALRRPGSPPPNPLRSLSIPQHAPSKLSLTQHAGPGSEPAAQHGRSSRGTAAACPAPRLSPIRVVGSDTELSSGNSRSGSRPRTSRALRRSDMLLQLPAFALQALVAGGAEAATMQAAAAPLESLVAAPFSCAHVGVLLQVLQGQAAHR